MSKLYKCTLCGTQVNPDSHGRSVESYIMEESSLCYYCAFWTNFIRNPHPNRICVDFPDDDSREVYHIASRLGENEPEVSDWGKGFGGHLFHIQMLSTGEIIHTDNLWCHGDVPKHFWDQFPPTAKFVRKGG